MANSVKNQHQSGAVSLFAVIFATLLLSILMIGFIKLMLQEQQRASNNDLSQSAYDSALVGVEDVKRVIRACNSGSGSAAAAACRAIEQPNDCRVVARAGINGTLEATETVIQSTTSSANKFDQAYSCVNLDMDTDDVLELAGESRSILVPLRATGPFDTVQIEWFTRDDMSGNNSVTAPVGTGLPPKNQWGVQTPSVLRAQVITPGENFTLDKLDTSEASQTVFLRPSGVVNGLPAVEVETGISQYARATDGQQHNNAPVGIICSDNFAFSNFYACRARLKIDSVSTAASVNSFLRINMIYKPAHMRVMLYNGATSIKFNGVQPSVDATGRASNLYRRVEARLRVGTDFPYPDSVVEVANSLCKDFAVAGNLAISGDCKP